MPLEMREKCETILGHMDEAFMCSYECTFCGPCTAGMNNICPNCGGGLVARPKRQPGN